MTVTPIANAEIVIGGCTVVDNPTPENFTVCPGVDLRDSDLHGLNFSYADLTDATLFRTNLSGTKLIGAKLADAWIGWANLANADLTGANLAGADLGSSDLANADLTGANLAGADMRSVDIADANFTGANLTGVTLATYSTRDTRGLNFTDANLTDANLRTILAGVELNGANLTGTHLTNADLTGTMLIPADTTVTADEFGNATVTWPTPPNLTGTTFGSCDRASGFSFPVGTTTVRCTVNTSASQGAGKFTVTVLPFPVLAPSIVGDPSEGVVGGDYTYAFEVSGSPAPTVTTTSELPAGLTLSKQGVLSGTPTEAGTFPITVTASNSAGNVDRQVTIVIASAPSIEGDPVEGVVGVDYTHAFEVAGSPAPTVTTTDPLPAGLTLSEDGVLSGTPTEAGSFPITVTASNSAGDVDRQVTVVVVAVPSIGGDPAEGVVGVDYNYAFDVAGSPTPTVTTTDPLPAGLTLSEQGILSGTPTAAGSFPITVTASNSAGDVDRQVTIVIASVPSIEGDPAEGVVGVDYTHAFELAGSPTPTVTTTDPLPAGLTLSEDGVLSGTPTEAGSFPITVTAGNSAGNVDRQVIVVVVAVPSIGGDPAEGVVGVDYNYAFDVAGSPTPTVTTTDPLPAGLTLSEQGILSGTPTAAGSFPITVTASNSAGDVDRLVTVVIASDGDPDTGSLDTGSLGTGSLGTESLESLSGS
ncbi:hypothetical protein BFN03_16950 [Rhodococcus sp. WMMA185]|uniref:pentapeptide repeat-containing protein n=1 Tax=Rhodococcus sp. WMMA185 TaxID=679318 RepID=UPI00087847AC|nr:pentapeptide repeat-containing protein [Rhodococcus sp. WMMA185]AOW93771.1 hypothetical protein BFN03_16950 [Rhodococcus sp. WMMA185]